MATAVLVGKEAVAHGTLSTTIVSVPAAFSTKLKQANKVLDEDRQGQDRHFALQVGNAVQEFKVAKSAIYHDTFGLWLCSAMGEPTSVEDETDEVWTSTFLFEDDPTSLSLQWDQPRRHTQAYQSLYGVVDELEIEFEADGELCYTCSGFGMPETEISAPTHAFSDAQPMPVWAGAVKIGGTANARLVKGKIGFKRNRSGFFTIANSKAPSKMNIGARTVEFDFTLDFDVVTEYDLFKAGTNSSLEITWIDTDRIIGLIAENPGFSVKLGTTAFEEAEIDTGGDLPLINISGKALYDDTDESLAVCTVTGTTDFAA